MARNDNCSNKHCNDETYNSMIFLTYYVVVLFLLSVFSFAFLVLG